MAARKVKAINEPAEVGAAESGIYIDPELVKAREADLAVLAALPPAAGPRPDPEIDPLLVEAREKEAARPDKELI